MGSYKIFHPEANLNNQENHKTTKNSGYTNSKYICAETYLKPSRTSMMELFAKIVNGVKYVFDVTNGYWDSEWVTIAIYIYENT